MSGTGGMRKMRLSAASSSRGKSGGVRVVYLVVDATVYVVAVFAKNDKSNLTKAEQNEAKKVADGLEKIPRKKVAGARGRVTFLGH